MKNVKTSTQANDMTAVCKLDDIVPFRGACALLSGKQIAFFRVNNDQLYAIDNFDPIGKAEVLSRGIVGDLKGEVVVASPLYKQHFNLVTGQCMEDSEVKVSTYPIDVKNGDIYISAIANTE